MTAAERWAAMDFDATDGLSVDELGIDYAWPEPGEHCLDMFVTMQLYWPALGPTVERRFSWRQPCCDECWVQGYHERIPVRVIDAETEVCVYCGWPTRSGIYVRIEPELAAFPTNFDT